MMWQSSKMAKVKKKLTAAQKHDRKKRKQKGKKIYVGFHEWKTGQ